MITDNGDTNTYASFGEPGPFGDSAPNDNVDSLDQVMAPGVAPPPYSEEFGGGGSPFDQPRVTDPSFQPQLADTPNPTSSTSPLVWFAIAAAGLMFMSGGKR